jgi:hypothetical protein
VLTAVAPAWCPGWGGVGGDTEAQLQSNCPYIPVWLATPRCPFAVIRHYLSLPGVRWILNAWSCPLLCPTFLDISPPPPRPNGPSFATSAMVLWPRVADVCSSFRPRAIAATEPLSKHCCMEMHQWRCVSTFAIYLRAIGMGLSISLLSPGSGARRASLSSSRTIRTTIGCLATTASSAAGTRFRPYQMMPQFGCAIAFISGPHLSCLQRGDGRRMYRSARSHSESETFQSDGMPWHQQG